MAMRAAVPLLLLLAAFVATVGDGSGGQALPGQRGQDLSAGGPIALHAVSAY